MRLLTKYFLVSSKKTWLKKTCKKCGLRARMIKRVWCAEYSDGDKELHKDIRCSQCDGLQSAKH
jgi:hypothetical protein